MATREHQRASAGQHQQALDRHTSKHTSRQAHQQALDWGQIPVYALSNLGRDDHMKLSLVLTGGAIAALCLLLAPVQVHAQSFTASLQGTVKDSTGAVVQGARLTLVNEATNVRQEKLSASAPRQGG